MVTACAPDMPEPDTPNLNKAAEPICKAPMASTPKTDAGFAGGYFPPEYAKPIVKCDFGLKERPVIGDIKEEWYSDQLNAASEPSLYAKASCEALPDFVMRFSYIPSFDPAVFIRVESDKDGLLLIAKQLSGVGGYEPGSIARSMQVRLTAAQATELRDLLSESALFAEAPSTCDVGVDGSQWIFESVDKGGYKMVDRWSPEEGAAHSVGRHLIGLTGWDVETY